MAGRGAVGGSLLQAAVGLLAVLTLDVSWPSGVVFAVLLGVAAVRSGSVESGVLILWVAAAAAAFLVLGAESLTGDVLHPLTRLTLYLATYAVLVLGGPRAFGDGGRDVAPGVVDRFMVALGLLWVSSWSPRSGLGAMGLLYAEDNQKWMMSVASELRGTNETIAVPMGSVNVQYFVRFVLAMLTSPTAAWRDGADVAALTLRVQANAWVWCLASVVILTPGIVRRAAHIVWSRPPSVAAVAASIVCAILAFGQAQSVGHYTQFQLTVVVIVTMAVLLRLAAGPTRGRIVWLCAAVVSLAAAIGGSYNPWMPIGIVVLLIGVILVVPATLWRRIRRWPILVAAGIGVGLGGAVSGRLFGRFAADLDMEGGVATTHLEALLLFVALALSAAVATVGAARRAPDGTAGAMRAPAGAEPGPSRISSALVVTAAVGPLLVWRLGASESTVVGVAALALGGMGMASLDVRGTDSARWVLRPSDRASAVLLLPLAVVSWVALIWVSSRYASAVREPRFAAWKSIVAMIGQLGFVPIVALDGAARGRRTFLRGAMVSGGVAAIFLTFGFRGRFGEDYVQSKWWHAPVLSELRSDPSVAIACVSGEVGTPDYETYTCNRYLETLGTDADLSGSFRYAAWYRAEALASSERAVGELRARPLVVVSPGPISDSWRAFFASAASGPVRYVGAMP